MIFVVNPQAMVGAALGAGMIVLYAMLFVVAFHIALFVVLFVLPVLVLAAVLTTTGTSLWPYLRMMVLVTACILVPFGLSLATNLYGIVDIPDFEALVILIGVPLAILTPFPFVPIGLPVVILGVVLLGRNAVWGRRWMERVLERHPTVEKYAPDWLMKLVFGRDKAHMHDD